MTSRLSSHLLRRHRHFSETLFPHAPSIVSTGKTDETEISVNNPSPSLPPPPLFSTVTKNPRFCKPRLHALLPPHYSSFYSNLHFPHHSFSTTPTPSIPDTSTLSPALDSVQSAVDLIANNGSEVAIIAGNHWLPTQVLQQLIESVHVYGGLPWWAAIAATTIGMRTLLFPLVVHQMKLVSRLAAAKPEIEDLMAKIKSAGYASEKQLEFQQQISQVYKKHNTNPFAPFGGAIAQASTFIFFFFAVQGMATHLESFKTGGALWFVDLSSPDAYFLLPVMTACTFLINVELGALEGMEGQPNAAQTKNLMRFLGLAMVPLTMNFPQALFCYWFSTNLFSLGQAQLFRNPSVKKLLGLPKPSKIPQSSTTPEENPFMKLKELFKQTMEENKKIEGIAGVPPRPKQNVRKGYKGKK